MNKKAIESCGYVEFTDGHKENVVLYDFNRTEKNPSLTVITESGERYFYTMGSINQEGIIRSAPMYRKFLKEKNEYFETYDVNKIRIHSKRKPIA